MSERDGGKGDTPRPLGIPMEQFDKNFEAIFGKKQPKTLKDYIGQKEKQMLEDAMDNRAKELMQEVKEMIGKK